ncbi:VWA domain-containing protein [Verrucomicrobiota bacterium]
MTFLYPAVFWALIFCPLLLLKGQEEGLRFPSLEIWRKSGVSRRQKWLWLPPWLRVLAAVLLIAACARPQHELESKVQKTYGIAMEILLDISSSMSFTMTYDNRQVERIEVAKQVLEAFVAGDDEALEGRSDDLIGLITFARYADTLSPLTYSHDALVEIIRDVEVNERPNEDGTAYGDASALAAARLRHLEEAGEERGAAVESKVILLLTDGENNCGRHLPLEAAALAKKWGFRIYTISITDAPATRKEVVGGELFQRVEELSEAQLVLKRMAEETGGIFRTATDYDTLRSVYEEIDMLEKSEIKTVTHLEVKEQYHLFAALALAVLLLECALRSTILRVAA